MASKAIYTVVAVVGIAGAATAAWWYPQPRPGSPDRALTEQQAAVAAAPPSLDAASMGIPTGRPPSVEVASVEVVTLTDDTQAVVLRPEVSGR